MKVFRWIVSLFHRKQTNLSSMIVVGEHYPFFRDPAEPNAIYVVVPDRRKM
ncbi:MAG TPA: hypothetical protein VIY69_11995 [Candidatus Acidoferrales bacterium]